MLHCKIERIMSWNYHYYAARQVLSLFSGITVDLSRKRSKPSTKAIFSSILYLFPSFQCCNHKRMTFTPFRDIIFGEDNAKTCKQTFCAFLNFLFFFFCSKFTYSLTYFMEKEIIDTGNFCLHSVEEQNRKDLISEIISLQQQL